MKKDIVLPSLNTVNTHSKLEVDVYELPHTVRGEYIVDDSNFVPISEAVKQLGANNSGNTDIKQYYDFPDGKDTGISVPITRTKNGKDIAEISSHIMESINDTADKLSTARKIAEKKAALDKSLSDIRSSMNSNNSPSSSK